MLYVYQVDLSIHDLWVLESARKEYFPLLAGKLCQYVSSEREMHCIPCPHIFISGLHFAETYPFTICRSTLLESSASAPPLLDISFFQASEESPDANVFTLSPHFFSRPLQMGSPVDPPVCPTFTPLTFVGRVSAGRSKNPLSL